MTKPKAQQAAEAAANKKGRGRPTSYSPHYVVAVRKLAARGWTEVEIGEQFNVSARTIRLWKSEHPEFSAACKMTDAEKLEAVKESLLHRALGFKHPAVKIMTVSVGGGVSQVVREEYIEHYPPDVAAIQFFLKNRDPDNWRDKQEIDQRTDAVIRVEGGLPDKEPE